MIVVSIMKLQILYCKFKLPKYSMGRKTPPWTSRMFKRFVSDIFNYLQTIIGADFFGDFWSSVFCNWSSKIQGVPYFEEESGHKSKNLLSTGLF